MIRWQQRNLSSYEVARLESIERNRAIFSNVFKPNNNEELTQNVNSSSKNNDMSLSKVTTEEDPCNSIEGDSKSTLTDTETSIHKEINKYKDKVNEEEIFSIFTELGGPTSRTRRAKRELEKTFFESIESEEKRAMHSTEHDKNDE